MDKKNLFDQIGRNILDELCEDARISFAELGKRVGLSPPAVIERVRRMEEAGIIKGYHADVELKEIGLPVMAFLQLRCPPEKYEKVISLSNKLTEVRECHHVSGSNSFVFRVAVASIADLEEIISGFSVYGETSTSIILSSPLRKHGRVLDDGS